MNTYSIADLTVNMDCSGKTKAQAEKYLIDSTENPDITLRLSLNGYESFKAQFPEVSEESYQYVTFARLFSSELLKHNGFVLHSSAVAYENKAYLFSADSGTGKSTHTSLWLESFKDAIIINDDKPAIRLCDDGKFYAFGTPWSGSTPLNSNVKVPLKAICFIERSECNEIEPITDVKEIISLILQQTLRKATTVKIDNMLVLLDKLIREVPFYKLKCRPDTDAALLAHKIMSK